MRFAALLAGLVGFCGGPALAAEPKPVRVLIWDEQQPQQAQGYGDKFLGDKAFAPVMDELHRRKATAYTHPNEPACCRNLSTGVPSVIIEYGTDTTRTIASLVFSGTAQRCPDINFIFSHGGGTLSALTERFNTQVVSFPDYKARGFNYDVVMGLLKRFYYDTAQAAHPMALHSLRELVAVSQILFGTDYPYIPTETAVAETKG